MHLGRMEHGHLEPGKRRFLVELKKQVDRDKYEVSMEVKELKSGAGPLERFEYRYLEQDGLGTVVRLQKPSMRPLL